VFTPTLTGLGERSHLASLGAIDCSTHIRDVLGVIRWEQLDGVVLCGHSYGGLVIGGVADAMPERIASVVYLDAVIPEDGKSMLDHLDPQMAEGCRAAVVEGLLPPFPAEMLGVNSADRAMVDALCTPQPFGTYTERLSLTGAHQAVARKAYVWASAWAGAQRVAETHYRQAADAGWETFEVSAGHDLMLDAPDDIARILARVI
jgi:pimeloyl-ACP methyl ester carboxylesterase